MRRDKFTAIPSDSEKIRTHSTVNWPVKFLLTKLHLIRDSLPRPELTVLVKTKAASGKLLNSTCAVHPEECIRYCVMCAQAPAACILISGHESGQ